jgi:hypothetical protein
MGWVPCDDTMLSETLQVIRLTESASRVCRLQKKNMNLCACDSEERVGCRKEKNKKWKRTTKKNFAIC